MSNQYGTWLLFDDIRTDAYGVWISGTGTYNAPERDQEFITIPGRSGNFIVDNGRFENIEVTYPAFIARGFDTLFDPFRAAMLSKRGYKRLEDTYHPDHFRLASFSGPIEANTGTYNRSGSFDLVFNCKPQLYLKSGETAETMTISGRITNPTLYPARPIIRVYGTGALGVGSVTVTIAANPFPYIDLDCEAMDAHSGASNANQYITLSGDDFPTLGPGQTGIALPRTITQVEITPRWWTI